MHIRTIGELHDTINAQAKEIELLKRKLKNSQSTISKFKCKYLAIKEPLRKRKNEKIYNKVAEWCEGSANRTLKSIADEFFVSYHTVKNIAYKWRKNNKVSA